MKRSIAIGFQAVILSLFFNNVGSSNEPDGLVPPIHQLQHDAIHLGAHAALGAAELAEHRLHHKAAERFLRTLRIGGGVLRAAGWGLRGLSASELRGGNPAQERAQKISASLNLFEEVIAKCQSVVPAGNALQERSPCQNILQNQCPHFKRALFEYTKARTEFHSAFQWNSTAQHNAAVIGEIALTFFSATLSVAAGATRAALTYLGSNNWNEYASFHPSRQDGQPADPSGTLGLLPGATISVGRWSRVSIRELFPRMVSDLRSTGRVAIDRASSIYKALREEEDKLGSCLINPEAVMRTGNDGPMTDTEIDGVRRGMGLPAQARDRFGRILAVLNDRCGTAINQSNSAQHSALMAQPRVEPRVLLGGDSVCGNYRAPTNAGVCGGQTVQYYCCAGLSAREASCTTYQGAIGKVCERALDTTGIVGTNESMVCTDRKGVDVIGKRIDHAGKE